MAEQISPPLPQTHGESEVFGVVGESALPPVRFWTWPYVTSVIFPNSISEARDLHAGERNFLAVIKGSIALVLAGFSLIFYPTEGDWFGSVLGDSLFALALVFPAVALWTYIHAFNAWGSSRGRVHHPLSFTALTIVTALVVLVVNLRELVRDGASSWLD